MGILSPCLAQEPTPPKSLVLVGGCSGVCLTADGYVATAKHCGHPSITDVVFPDGKSFKAAKVFEVPLEDGACILKILDKGTYPFSPIAKTKPAKGDDVYCWGYPAGGGPSGYNGNILDGFIDERSKIAYIETTIMAWHGVSGGPLFNQKGEVLGLCLLGSTGEKANSPEATNTFSAQEELQWCLTEAKKLKTPEAYTSQTRRIVVYSAVWCSSCQALKHDIEAGCFPGYTFEIRDIDSLGVRMSVPTLQIENTQYTLTQICGRLYDTQCLLGWLQNKYPSRRQPIPENPGKIEPIPDTQPAPPSAPSANPILHVSVSVSRVLGDTGNYEFITSEVVDIASRALESKLTASFPNTKVKLITQRARPTAYGKLQSIHPGAPVCVYLGVQEADLAWWQGGAATLVEQAVQSALAKLGDKIPVYVVFERTDPVGYATLSVAADTEESIWSIIKNTPLSQWAKPSTWLLWVITAMVPMGWVMWIRRGWFAVKLAKWLAKHARAYLHPEQAAQTQAVAAAPKPAPPAPAAPKAPEVKAS